MKLFKALLLFVFLQVVSFTQAQDSKIEISSSVDKLDIMVNTIEELKTIDWDEMFTVFDENEPNDSIKVSIQLADMHLSFEESEGEGVLNSLHVEVADKTKNSDVMKRSLKKSTNGIIRMIEILIK